MHDNPTLFTVRVFADGSSGGPWYIEWRGFAASLNIPKKSSVALNNGLA